MRRNVVKYRYKRKRLLYRFLSIVVFFALLGGVYEAIRIVQFHLEEKNLQREIDLLKRENQEMAETRDKLENDPAEIERRAREELGMMKKGERIYRVIEPRTKESDDRKEKSE